MKTKLTLNVDDKIVARAKKVSAKKNVSLSAVVEEYLDKFSKNYLQKDVKAEPSLIERIRKYTHHVEISEAEIDKRIEEHMQEKYGL
ncbi:MAG: DUF6364 family protein [Ginsengibacter sp.]